MSKSLEKGEDPQRKFPFSLKPFKAPNTIKRINFKSFSNSNPLSFEKDNTTLAERLWIITVMIAILLGINPT